MSIGKAHSDGNDIKLELVGMVHMYCIKEILFNKNSRYFECDSFSVEQAENIISK